MYREWVKISLLAFKIVCAVIIFFASSFTIYTVGPAIETKWFPVVSKLRIIDVSEDENGNAVILAEFTKLRDCEYLGLAWFRGKPDKRFERVPVILMRQEGDTSSPNRPTGSQRAGPWVIGMSPAEVPKGSFARLYHTCHGFWTTTMDFWP